VTRAGGRAADTDGLNAATPTVISEEATTADIPAVQAAFHRLQTDKQTDRQTQKHTNYRIQGCKQVLYRLERLLVF